MQRYRLFEKPARRHSGYAYNVTKSKVTNSQIEANISEIITIFAPNKVLQYGNKTTRNRR